MGKNTGFKNEKQLLNTINNKTIAEISQEHIKDFLYELYPEIKNDDMIICEEPELYEVKRKGKKFNINPKQDLIITVQENSKYISVKEGNGNSVHQEPLEQFIEFLVDELRAPSNVVESLKKYHWGDGTLTGNGKKENRLKNKALKNEYEKEINIVQNFYDKNKYKIAKRAMITGAYHDNQSYVDYIYHGTIEEGVWCSADQALNIICNPENIRKPISVGLLTFQNQNRNTTLNKNKENARKSIQFKWSGMESVLRKRMPIRKRIKYSTKQVVKGNNSHGFRNVKQIINLLDGNEIQQIKQDTLKKFVTYVFPKAKGSAIISCEAVNNKEKGNMKITVGDKSYKILVKIGSNNSIHQEEYETFYEFLKMEFDTSKELIRDLKKIQWADGTLDGSAPTDKWLKGNEIKENYLEEIKRLQNYLEDEKIARGILNRCLIYGMDNTSEALDYIYFGSPNEAYWAKATDVVQYEIDRLKIYEDSSLLGIGAMSLQTWGRTIKKNGKDQREAIQMKAKKLQDTVKYLAKQRANQSFYVLADESEKNFVKNANLKDNLELQQQLGVNKNVYAVQVTSKQSSIIHHKKIKTKSDAYFISLDGMIDDSILLEQDYILLEEDIEGINHDKLPYSGVSIKREGSNSYTFLKISRSSFEKLFGLEDDYFIASMFYITEKDLSKNIKIIEDNESSLNRISKTFGIDVDAANIDDFKYLKEKAMDEIKVKIDLNKDIYDSVFFGTGLFKEPYCATYLYQDSLIHKKDLENINYYLSTGSGRSKGRYTLIVKPK